MRCDDVPRLLATGTAIGRWRARRHAAHCPRCAAFRSVLDELATVPPLPDSHRALWARAADEAATVRLTWSRFVRPVAAIAAAAAMIGFIASDEVCGGWFVLGPCRAASPSVGALISPRRRSANSTP